MEHPSGIFWDKMTELYSLKARELDSGRDNLKSEPCTIITANSIETRMKKLERKARGLARDIHRTAEGSNAQQQYAQKGMNLLKEYSLLFAKIVDPETYELEEDRLRKDVPWNKIGELKTKGTEFKRDFRQVFSHFNPGEIAECLELMSESDLKNFKVKMNAKIGKVSTRLNAERNQADPQVNHQANQQHKRNMGGRKK